MPAIPDELLNTAVGVLAADPTASMQEIAEAAGISRATLNRRFAGREDLLRAIAEWAVGRMEEIATEIDRQGLTGRPAIEVLLENAVALAPKIGFLINECSLENDEAFMGRVDAALSRWHNWIEEGQRRGEFRVDLPAVWIAGAIEGLVVALFHGIRRGLIAPVDGLRLIRLTLLEGVVSRA